MITNKKQFAVTLNHLETFSASASDLLENTEIDPLLKHLQVSAIFSQIRSFQDELLEYIKPKIKVNDTATAASL